jgi:hypothetical protein
MAGKNSGVSRSDFVALLADVKGRIQAAQTRAVLSVNAELVRLYWDIGRIIDGRRQREGWGAAAIPRLAKALKNEFPELKGLSERNIDRMISFYRQYSRPDDFSPPAVAKLRSQEKVPQTAAQSRSASKVQPPVAQLEQPLTLCSILNALPGDLQTAGGIQLRWRRQTHRYLDLRADASAAERAAIGPANSRGN